MRLYWENLTLTLPAFLLIFRLSLDSVVDIGDIHPVDEGTTQLNPGVDHHLPTKIVLWHITHLVSNDYFWHVIGCGEIFTSLHILSSSVVSTTCKMSTRKI